MSYSPSSLLKRATDLLSRIPLFRRLDLHEKEGLKGFSTAFVFKVIAAGIGFIASIIVARLVGAAGVGILSLTSVVVAVATTVGQLGIGSALVRFIGAEASKRNWHQVAGAYHTGFKVSLVSLSAVAGAVFIMAEPLALHVFNKPDLTLPLRIMSLAIVPSGLISLKAEALRGLKLIRQSINLQQIAPQLISLPFVVILAYKWKVVGVVSASVISTLLVLAYSIRLWRQSVPEIVGVAGSFEKKRLLSTSLPLLWVGVMHLVMSMADTAILGIWWDSHSVGLYSAALRVSSLLSFLLTAINTIAAPQFAALYGQNDISSLERLARHFTKLGTAMALPVFAVIVLFGRELLQMFGSEFTGGYHALLVLSAGQVLNIAAGSVGCLLAMTDNERTIRNITIFCAMLNVAMNLAMIPIWGIIGAALASAATHVAFNTLGLIFVKRRLSISTLPM